MSVHPHPAEEASARATRAWTRADARLAAEIDDLFVPNDARLDERTRVMVTRTLVALIGRIETELRRYAARVLADGGATARAEMMLEQGDVFARLARARLLRDVDLLDELLARVRLDVIAENLPPSVGGADAPSLLVRLTDVPDTVVARAASALLAAQSRRRAASELGNVEAAVLPADVQHRLVWRIAAALRPGSDPASDRAIVQAAQRSLAHYDEGERPESVSMRLAVAIDARAHELGPLLIEALGDRNPTLLVAVLAHALRMDQEEVRAMVVDPEGERLWLALRACDLDRPTIAQIALALSDADPRRDIEAFADRLDAIAEVPVAEATAALAPFTLDRDFRAAMAALARSERR